VVRALLTPLDVAKTLMQCDADRFPNVTATV
jgi:hypothetical protein